MACHNTQEFITVTPETYQELTRRTTQSWLCTQYFLLTNACLENIKQIPTTTEEYEQADIENLLIDGLERLANALTIILPGGFNEFQSYLDDTPYTPRCPRPSNRQ